MKTFILRTHTIILIDDKNKVHIFQVRPIVIKNNENLNNCSDLDIYKAIEVAKDQFINLQEPGPFILGKKSMYGIMPDWNPAEIIGLKPKNLAMSLYQNLITNEIWSESRLSLGYKNVTKIPLLHSFLGTPYIDLKTDINSFLIDSLSEKIQKKLIKFYFKEFKKSPHHYYDKIESDLVVNCISINPQKYKNILKNSKLSKNEINVIIKEYTKLTNQIIFKLDENIKKYQY
jgi:hypothetical protein